jgi:hypothetical protein
VEPPARVVEWPKPSKIQRSFFQGACVFAIETWLP